MGFFDRFMGSRWSLQIRKGRAVSYTVSQDSVIRIVAPLAPLFLREGNPPAPWHLHLRQNRKGRDFELDKIHFSTSASPLSDLLRRELDAIDRGWNGVAGAEPVAMNVRTGNTLPMFSCNPVESLSGTTTGPQPSMAAVLCNIFRGSGDDGA